ncbi:MAG: magnesium transporter [Parachlamydiales bacterium]
MGTKPAYGPRYGKAELSGAKLDNLLSEKLKEAVHSHTQDIHLQEVARIACEHSPIDLAYAVAYLPPDARPYVYENLPDWEAKVAFFLNTDESTQTHVFRHLSGEEVAELVSRMPADEAVYVLDNLPDRRIRRLFQRLDPELTQRIRELQRHDRLSAGRMMTSEFFAFGPEMLVGEAVRVIRDHPGIKVTESLFVVDPVGQLLGRILTRTLLVSPDETPIRQVMQSVTHRVMVSTPRDEVIELVERYTIPSLAVVDEEERLVGIIRADHVIEACEDVADETIFQMAGTLEDVSAHQPVWKRFLSRAPWLIVTLFGGLLNAGSISYFGSLLPPWMGFVVFFIPLITGMSGNVGVQCSTVLVRGMAIGSLLPGKWGEAIWKEIAIGLLAGSVFGLLCGVLVYGLNTLGIHSMGIEPLFVGAVVSAGLFGACLTATLLGVFSPLFFARIGVDPAVASGPIVTAFNDVLSMVMYFVIASGIGGLFLLTA